MAEWRRIDIQRKSMQFGEGQGPNPNQDSKRNLCDRSDLQIKQNIWAGVQKKSSSPIGSP